MPELPEVETIKRDLIERVVSSAILDVRVFDGRVIRSCAASTFIKKCRGRTIVDCTRKGKAILFQFDNAAYLVIQPMMTGQLICAPHFGKTPREKATKITFRLSNGMDLNYNDQRLFGRLHCVKDLRKVEFLNTIGPDPFEEAFKPDWLKSALAPHRGPIKTLLMNQQFVAGIGNIYASEILFKSRIAPKRAANSLNFKEITKLHQVTQNVLNEAIKFRGTSMLTYRDSFGREGSFIRRIKVYGRENEACRVCRSPITKVVMAGRSTFYCSSCQK